MLSHWKRKRWRGRKHPEMWGEKRSWGGWDRKRGEARVHTSGAGTEVLLIPSPLSVAGAGGPALRSQPQQGSSGVGLLLAKGQDVVNLLRAKTQNPWFPTFRRWATWTLTSRLRGFPFVLFLPQHKYCKRILLLEPRQRGEPRLYTHNFKAAMAASRSLCSRQFALPNISLTGSMEMSLAPSGQSTQKQPVRLDEDNEVICLSCNAWWTAPAGFTRFHIHAVTELHARARARVIGID